MLNFSKNLPLKNKLQENLSLFQAIEKKRNVLSTLDVYKKLLLLWQLLHRRWATCWPGRWSSSWWSRPAMSSDPSTQSSLKIRWRLLYRFPDVHYSVREPPPPLPNDFPLQKYDNNSPCHATILAFPLLFCIYFYINSVFPLPFLTHFYSLFSLPFLNPPPP